MISLVALGRRRRATRFFLGGAATATVAVLLTAVSAASEPPSTPRPALAAGEVQGTSPGFAEPQSPAWSATVTATTSTGKMPPPTVPPATGPAAAPTGAPVDAPGGAGSAAPVVTGLAADGIPSVALAAYRRAAAAQPASCAIPWPLLAAIGRVESDHGRFGSALLRSDGTSTEPIIGIPLDGHGTALIRDTDGGRLDGDRSLDRAVGPMQFIPSTWALYGTDGNGDSVVDPFNIYDSAAAAARYLCAAGGDLSTAVGQRRAVLAYNDSDAYLASVLALEQVYAADAPGLSVPVPQTPPRPVHRSPLPPVDPGPPPGLDHSSVPARHPGSATSTPSARPSTSAPTRSPTSALSTKPASTSAASTSAPSTAPASTAPATTAPTTTAPTTTAPTTTAPTTTAPTSTSATPTPSSCPSGTTAPRTSTLTRTPTGTPPTTATATPTVTVTATVTGTAAGGTATVTPTATPKPTCAAP
ncbi:MAG: lytic transglycosylase domain-containing protein [bacterium]